MRSNLTTQGYCLSDGERRELWLGVRFSTGLCLTLVIVALGLESPVMVLSHYVEERYATDLITSDTRGFGYLLKDRVADVPAFLDAVMVVAGGGTLLDPEVVSQILARSHRHSVLDQLTPREREVLQLMAEGRTNSAIAATLHMSTGSAEKHIASIFTKLGLVADDTENRRVLAVLRYLES